MLVGTFLLMFLIQKKIVDSVFLVVCVVKVLGLTLCVRCMLQRNYHDHH